MVVRTFIIIILAYSARKNSANGPAAYSTLNPDTSSDSPSVRSKGARLVSARVEMYHIIISGHVDRRSHEYSCVMIRLLRVNDPLMSRTDKIIIANVTSYEIVCATARRAPINAYFEFEAHPDHKIEYTDRLDTANINNTPKCIFTNG